KDRCAQAQGQLDLVRADLASASDLVGVSHDIAKARAELKQLKGETAKEAKALEALVKQRTEAETQLVALRNDAQRLIAIRSEGEAVMANLRRQLQSVQIGIRP